MKLKLFFLFSFFFFISINAQDYIFGKVVSEGHLEMPDVTVINIRTDERVATNKDGHFMISGRQGDELRFVKSGYERSAKKASTDAPLNVTLTRAATLIQEVEIKQGLTGDLKIDSKNMNRPKKVEKLIKDLDRYIAQKSDPRVLAARPGEFVQPVTKGTFSLGKVKNKWDDVDLMSHLISALGPQYFEDLKIEKSQIQHFIYYIFAGGFERKTILKYGYCSDADLMRFQRAVLTRISTYKAPQASK
ncbi:hypothetical protein HNP38_001730 [Chryseobacterium defluvii]|uniref:Carboxypeptidase-like protein n=1 Tax=Chryseobacterium defluvii TaxID=160396 RepID=A0A840KFD0_9FLAO|nr:carboxypeptidase-like regulatory domain-containing protein [Chryseobacterium defluvii]MBB4806434.1 hypothetical protein [Chryseobacterium defluvii]